MVRSDAYYMSLKRNRECKALTWIQTPVRDYASGGSRPCNQEGAQHFARRGRNAEAFLMITGIYMQGKVGNRKKDPDRALKFARG